MIIIMLDNKIGNISIRYCLNLLYKFCNFVILSGLLLFVFGVESEVAFCIFLTHFPFLFSSNKCANYPKYT